MKITFKLRLNFYDCGKNVKHNNREIVMIVKYKVNITKKSYDCAMNRKHENGGIVMIEK